MFGENTRNFVLTKIEYGSPQWQVSLATSFKEGADTYDGYYHTSQGEDYSTDLTSIALRAYWKPDTTGSIPEVQVGYDLATVDNAAAGDPDEMTAWMVGLGWKDLFIDGGRAGVAFGSRQAATSYVAGGATTEDPSEENSVWEAYYTFKVNDGVSVTPAVFGGSDVVGTDQDVNGAVLLTEFRF